MAMYFGFVVIKVSQIDMYIMEARTALVELKASILMKNIEESNKQLKEFIEKNEKILEEKK